MKTFLTILITVILTATAGWFFFLRGGPDSGSADAERKPLFYQSAMHPWVKSDAPGRCTICGMELTPVYPGEKGFDATGGDNILALTQSQIQVLHVQTVKADTRPLTRSLHVAGMIDDDATRHRILSAYVDGRIEKLHVNYVGAEVAAGEPLAEIYSAPLLQAEREYRQLTGDFRRNTALRLRQMGLTPEQIAALDSKPADTLTSPILAPIGGTVVGQKVYEGQTVKAGDPLFEIADFSIMWFLFEIYEQDLQWLAPGQKVTVRTQALPGQSFEGKITFIDPNFDDMTRSTKVRVELPNPLVNGRRALLHKLYAEAVVEIDAPPVLTVPRSAVIQTGPEAVVYVDRGDGAYERTPVTLGRRGDEFLEVLSGLSAGDPVVTNGNLLMDGQAEMNRTFMVAEVAPPAADAAPADAPPAQPLTEDQQKVVAEFLETADSMAVALAADDLPAFTKASEPTMAKTAALAEALATHPELKQPLETLVGTSHFHGFADLKAARAAFLKFSTAAEAVAQKLRPIPGTPKFQVWECPMVDEAVPDAPARGRWLQLGARPGRNPYFGKEMLECGKEIKPTAQAK
jgi:Cu(I)/Ag(I) efflux system membrane fusion protein